jgi:hypothetical protein
LIEIRSYRRVFDLERRIYSVDRLRLNPAGVPVRGVLYFLALAALVLVGGHLPVLGALTETAPWYLRELALPAGLASGLALLRVDGRTAHVAAAAAARALLEPRRLTRLSRRSSSGATWSPPPFLAIPDGSDASFRGLRYTGPGAVIVRAAHERVGAQERGRVGFGSKRAPIRLRAVAGDAATNPEVLLLRPGVSLVVEPEREQP